MTQTILHIDFNSFFASAEQQANPFLRGKAIAVGGKPGERTIVSTASREAKARGVKTHAGPQNYSNIFSKSYN